MSSNPSDFQRGKAGLSRLIFPHRTSLAREQPKGHRMKKCRAFRDLCKPEKLVYARKLRENPTFAESFLWKRLSRLRYTQEHILFRRQARIFGWIADFYCPSARLVVEVDGGYHNTPLQQRSDCERDRVLREHNFQTLRFTSQEVFQNTQRVVNTIIHFTRERKRRFAA